ncbi:MAG: hypothetical protein FJX74_01585 [Armatimonadetes bacterium]|nr:hypothetical protein [Armatimonadota bacterium]
MGHALLSLLALVSTVDAQEGRIEGWTYTTAAPPLTAEWADTTPSKLSDGDLSPGRSVILSGGTIVLDLALPAVERVTAVRAHTYRHNMNYKLEKMVVAVRRFGEWQTVGEAQGYWADTEEHVFPLAVEGFSETTDALRLTFVTASIVSLQEIEVLGQSAAGGGERALNVPEAPTAGLSYRELDADGDGKPDLVLENGHLRMVLTPSRGGVCASLLLKASGLDLTAPPEAGMGLFRDQLWEPDYSFADCFYSTGHGGDVREQWVELRAGGVGGMLGFTSVRKRLRLREGSPVVRIEWELSNDPSSQTEYVYAPWFHNFTGVAGTTNTYYFPTEEGVKELVLPRRGEAKPALEEWFFDPARGWTAVVSDGGAGLAITMEYKRLNCFYHWAGTTSTTATHEWRFSKFAVPAGESLKTEFQLTPFSGLARVDGAIPGAVGELVTEGPVEAKLFLAAGEPAGEALLERRAWPEGAWQAIARRPTVAPEAAALGSITALPLAEPLPPGAYELRLSLVRGGESLPVAERPYAVGELRFAYRMTPPEPRIGLAEKAAATLGHELEMTVESPHFPWARPAAAGRLKALVLVDDRYCREIIELAQRADLDFSYVKFYTTLDEEWKYHGDLSIQTLAQAQERLTKALETEFDVIVLSGLKWDHHFTPAIRSRIEEQVRAGTGLVYIEPEGFTDEDMGAWPMMGVARGKPMGEFHAWESVGDHPVTRALPWETMPRTRRMTYDPAPTGEVLATFADGAPLIVAGQVGAGRVLSLSYDTLTHDYNYRGYSALTPILSYRGGFLLDEFRALRHPYWELWYALLARCVAWVSGRPPACELGDLQPQLDLRLDAQGRAPAGSRLSCVLQGPVRPGPGSIRWRVVDKLGGERLDVTRAVELKADARVEHDLPPLLPGRSLVFVRVSDAAGGALAWGATYIEAQGPASLTALEPAADILLPAEPDASLPAGSAAWRQWSPTEPLRVTVGVDVVQPSPPEVSLRLAVFDTHRREVARETRPVPAATEAVRFELPLTDLVNEGLEVVAELRSGEAVLDRATRRVIAPRPQVWDRFTFTSWGGIYFWRSEYLFDLVGERVESLGLDYAFNGINEFGTGRVWNDYWRNLGHSELGLLSYMGRDVPDFVDARFAEKSKQYAETGDRAALVREPCLNDPEWRAKVKAAIQARVRERLPYGGCYDYCMGDEMSLTYYTQYHDYCWCEHCLAGFRTWLEARYGDLERLNAAWETQHAGWPNVVPMTLKDAKVAENPAPWADHRAFMDDTAAGFFAFVQAAIEAVDPGAKAGLSGTQSPEAGNGMDWWKLSRAFTYYHSYNTSWSNEMRRSFQAAGGADQSPYYLGYWQSGRKVEYNGFWCLLHDTKGISAWYTPLFFYGDLADSECGASTREYVREMKEGLWDVIRAATRRHDGIAILYSQASVRAAALLDRPAALNASRDSWVKIIEDLGLQYEFICPEQIAEGALDPESTPFRACVLPMAMAISPAEARALTAFAEAGGTVIADAWCGVTDELCRRPGPEAATKLFGLHREPLGIPGAGVGIVTTEAVGGLPAQSAVRLGVAETDLLPDGAVALAGSVEPAGLPALLRHEVGKGHAYYLNLDLTQFEQERRFHSPTEIHVRQIVAAALADAGVQRPVGVTFESGRPPHVEVVRYRDGELEYVGLLRAAEAGAAETAQIALPRKALVYDARAGRRLGEMDSLRVPLEPGEARVFCLSPAPLPAPTLRAPDAVALGGRLIVGASVPPAAGGAARVLRLRVTDPSGRLVEDYSRNLILRGGEAELALPIALNDVPGDWRVTLTDRVTGEVSAQTCRVAPAGPEQ